MQRWPDRSTAWTPEDYISATCQRYGSRHLVSRSQWDNPFCSHPPDSPNECYYDPPPPYSPGPAQNVQPTMDTSSSAGAIEDRYAFLESFNVVFLIDDSGSMAGRAWRETREALKTIVPICTERDTDGIDLYFLNHPDPSICANMATPEMVMDIFQTVRPGGSTPTGRRLQNILGPYLQCYEKDPRPPSL